MPRNAAGTYTLPAGNPVQSGTPISSTVQNNTTSDIAAALTDSLSRSGLGGMLAPLPFVAGNVAAPGISWASELTTGFYFAGVNDMRAGVAGGDRQRWTATWTQLWDGVDWSDVVTLKVLDGVLVDYPLSAANETITGAWSFANGINVAVGLTVAAGAPLTLFNAGSSASATIQMVGTTLILTATQVGFNSGATAVSQLTSVGYTLLNGKKVAFNNAANSANRAILCGTADELITEGRGGLFGWVDANLPRGRVTIAAVAPAASGNPGDIVFVYE